MSGAWDDLRPRVISAIVLIGIGALAIWAGHWAFTLVVVLAGAVGIWEIYGMARTKTSNGGLSGRDYGAVAGYAILMLTGLWGLVFLSDIFGRGLVLFLISLVALTDTMGYFAGKSIGGPKFWPAISPKKTWSGIAAGWLGAAVLALCVHGVIFGHKGPPILVFALVAVALSFASQLGDIAQSALKRRMGVKDSSHIIPGHGGVLDRFDGLLAVAALAGLLAVLDG